MINRLPNLIPRGFPAVIGLVLAAFPIILFGLVLPSDTKQGTFINPRLVALYALLLFVFFASLLSKNNLRESLRSFTHLPAYFYLLIAYLVIVCLSAITSSKPGVAWFGDPTTQAGALFLLALALLFTCYSRFKAPGIMSVYAVIAFAAALLTLAQFLGFRPVDLLTGQHWNTSYPIGTTAYRGHLAGMFAFLSLLPLYVFYKRRKTAFFWFWIVAGNIGLGLATSSAATLACAVCLVIYLAVSLFTARTPPIPAFPHKGEGAFSPLPVGEDQGEGRKRSFRGSLAVHGITRSATLPLIPAFSPREKGQNPKGEELLSLLDGGGRVGVSFRHALVVALIFAASIYGVPRALHPINTFLVNHRVVSASSNASPKNYENTKSFKARFLLWKAAFHMWQARPWLGWGDQQFNDNVFAFSSKADGDDIFRMQLSIKPGTKMTRIGDMAGYVDKEGVYGLHKFTVNWPHNILLEQLEAHGILGLLAYLAFFVTLLFSVFLRAKGRGIVAALPYLAYFIYLTAWFYTVSVTPLAWMLLGAIVYDLQRREAPTTAPEAARVGPSPLPSLLPAGED